jgi:G3E family GTPase
MCLVLHRDLPDKVRLDGIVTVVDAKHVSRHLDEAEADPEKVSEAVEQVGVAALHVACTSHDMCTLCFGIRLGAFARS